jgi:hypothetical protein
VAKTIQSGDYSLSAVARASDNHHMAAMCGRVIQSSGPMRYGLVESMDIRDSRGHNYPRRWKLPASRLDAVKPSGRHVIVRTVGKIISLCKISEMRSGSTTVLEACLSDFRSSPDSDRICDVSDVA